MAEVANAPMLASRRRGSAGRVDIKPTAEDLNLSTNDDLRKLAMAFGTFSITQTTYDSAY